MGRIWDDVLTPADRAAYAKARKNEEREPTWGQRPAVLVVDMTAVFVEDRFPLGSAAAAAPAIAAIQGLLDAARAAALPIFFTTGRPPRAAARGRWKGGALDDPALLDPAAHEVTAPLAPAPGEPVIAKDAPSAFFGTPLLSWLLYDRVDTLVVTGMSTGGCVRATVSDAFAHQFYVVVPEEAVADRSPTGHKVALYEMHMKYADVVPCSAVLTYVARYRADGGRS